MNTKRINWAMVNQDEMLSISQIIRQRLKICLRNQQRRSRSYRKGFMKMLQRY